MANMLIRTSKTQCDYKVLVLVRVCLFFGIPTLYLLLNNNELQYQVEDSHDDIFRSRNLLGIVERGHSNCTPAAILEFPPDGLTHLQRRQGFIAIHCVLALYCFLLLGVICEHYFVPAIKIICEKLDMAEDVAGATFMAAASSSPELFINCIGTFVTKGDLGVGAILGSAVFNVLAVPACCGIIARKVIELDWWSVSRDCLMYAVAVVALILTLLDDIIYWHEALLLVLMYTGYILAMVFNGRLGNFARSGCCIRKKRSFYTEVTPLITSNGNGKCHQYETPSPHTEIIELGNKDEYNELESSTSSVWSWPGEKTAVWKKCYWVLTWPISLLLWFTIPDCRKHNKLFPVTFMMCVVWIGGVSYVIAWIITILGDTLDIPDSITGITILAAGTSLPEAISSVVVTNQGHGSMGISNTIGSNTFDILLCLGLPWLVKALFFPTVPGHHWVAINSSGMSYTAISLLSTLLALYGCLALNRFQLDWKLGVLCIAIYAGFLLLATLIELNFFFVVNLPVCPH